MPATYVRTYVVWSGMVWCGVVLCCDYIWSAVSASLLLMMLHFACTCFAFHLGLALPPQVQVLVSCDLAPVEGQPSWWCSKALWAPTLHVWPIQAGEVSVVTSIVHVLGRAGNTAWCFPCERRLPRLCCSNVRTYVHMYTRAFMCKHTQYCVGVKPEQDPCFCMYFCHKWIYSIIIIRTYMPLVAVAVCTYVYGT